MSQKLIQVSAFGTDSNFFSFKTESIDVKTTDGAAQCSGAITLSLTVKHHHLQTLVVIGPTCILISFEILANFFANCPIYDRVRLNLTYDVMLLDCSDTKVMTINQILQFIVLLYNKKIFLKLT